MHVKQRVFCISGTSFCSTHLFLTFQALDFNMLQPHSAINLSLSALAFLLKVIFFSLCIPIFNSPLLTQINLSPTPTLLPCKCMKHTDIHARRLALTETHTNTQPCKQQQPQRPHINKSAPLLALSVSAEEKESEGGAGQKSSERKRLRWEKEVTEWQSPYHEDGRSSKDKSVFTSKSVLCITSLATYSPAACCPCHLCGGLLKIPYTGLNHWSVQSGGAAYWAQETNRLRWAFSNDSS